MERWKAEEQNRGKERVRTEQIRVPEILGKSWNIVFTNDVWLGQKRERLPDSEPGSRSASHSLSFLYVPCCDEGAVLSAICRRWCDSWNEFSLCVHTVCAWFCPDLVVSVGVVNEPCTIWVAVGGMKVGLTFLLFYTVRMLWLRLDDVSCWCAEWAVHSVIGCWWHERSIVLHSVRMVLRWIEFSLCSTHCAHGLVKTWWCQWLVRCMGRAPVGDVTVGMNFLCVLHSVRMVLWRFGDVNGSAECVICCWRCEFWRWRDIRFFCVPAVVAWVLGRWRELNPPPSTVKFHQWFQLCIVWHFVHLDSMYLTEHLRISLFKSCFVFHPQCSLVCILFRVSKPEFFAVRCFQTGGQYKDYFLHLSKHDIVHAL